MDKKFAGGAGLRHGGEMKTTGLFSEESRTGLVWGIGTFVFPRCGACHLMTMGDEGADLGAEQVSPQMVGRPRRLP